MANVEIPEDYRRFSLSGKNFSLNYDADHRYYFFEGEDGEGVYAYGHVDKKKFAKDVLDYYRYTAGEDFDDDSLDESNVSHVYAVGIVPIDAPTGQEEDYDMRFLFCGEMEQNAKPITVLTP